MKFLIAGLGNVGEQYSNTRHNIGFEVLDHFAYAQKIDFENARYAHKANVKIKGKTLVLIKPNTFMNLSGKALRYWLKKEKIPIERLLVVVDDIALPLGKIRLRAKGSAGGHNGLQNIQDLLQTTNYARLRMGIGDTYTKGRQIEYVLGKWQKSEWITLQPLIETAASAITAFCLQGIEPAMTQYNS